MTTCSPRASGATSSTEYLHVPLPLLERQAIPAAALLPRHTNAATDSLAHARRRATRLHRALADPSQRAFAWRPVGAQGTMTKSASRTWGAQSERSRGRRVLSRSGGDDEWRERWRASFGDADRSRRGCGSQLVHGGTGRSRALEPRRSCRAPYRRRAVLHSRSCAGPEDGAEPNRGRSDHNADRGLRR